MNLQQIREALPERLRAEIDLDLSWRLYCAAGGLDDEDAFVEWIAERYPHAFDPHRTVPVDTVEVSAALPARLAGEAAPPRRATAATDGVADDADEEPTVIMMPSVAAPAGDDAASAANPAASAASREFHYELIGTAGKGGMGVVHIARDTELLRRVALKQLNPLAESAASGRLRFLREVQITAQLDHPNIVPVYALELAPGGSPAYTMKLVQGKTLLALLDEAAGFHECGQEPDEARSLPARLEHFLKVCDAIAYAHDKGVIHRDLKPANLMLGRHNEVYVMDWGLCRALHAGDDVPVGAVTTSGDSGHMRTQLGDLIGTPRYMAPEQAQGRNDALDARSDQYALGLILQEIVTLKPAYEGRTPHEVIAVAEHGRRRPVVHAYLGRDAIARELVAVIDKATALDPGQRYPSVAEFAADLRRYLRGEAVQARPDDLWQRAQRAIGRNRQRVLTGILVLIAVAASAIGLLLWKHERESEAQRLREERLLHVSAAVNAVGNRVQTRMLQLEGAMESMASSVEEMSEFGSAVDNRFYLAADFRDAATAPPDLAPAPDFGSISLTWPVWTLPPGMDRDAALPTIRKLAALQPFRRELYHRVAVMMANPDADMYAAVAGDRARDADSNAISAIVIGLDNGISSRYPGWDGMPDDYDPRTRPWYELAAGRNGPQWGDPYLSSVSHRRELPLSVPLRDAEHRFFGVVSALLAPDRLLRQLLEVRDAPAVRGVYLLGSDGRVLTSAVSSSTSGALSAPTPGALSTPASGALSTSALRVASASGDTAADASEAPLFPQADVVKRIGARRAGVLETSFEGRDAVFVLTPIEPIGWTVVGLADAGVLFDAQGPANNVK